MIDARGIRLGTQPKTQIALEEDALYVPESGRRLFTTAGLTSASRSATRPSATRS